MLLVHLPYSLIADRKQNKAMGIRGEQGIGGNNVGHVLAGFLVEAGFMIQVAALFGRVPVALEGTVGLRVHRFQVFQVTPNH
jgi:hypothetical protein